MKIPIVLSAFGTTTRALDTYKFLDEIFKEKFPSADIRWAYSSRMVKDFIKTRKNIDLRHPHEILADLLQEGHSWAIVQSIHLICGHEFYRLIEEVKGCDIRTSIGMPLLYTPEDYIHVAKNFQTHKHEDEAVVLIGHGTDHPSWTSYLAMNQILNDTCGDGIYMGMIEGEYLSPEDVREKVLKAGYKKVRLIPFMIVAGVHFKEDINAESDSWRSFFEEAGIQVSVEDKGLGLQPDIGALFAQHIQEATDIIPDNSL